jgi:hypothetical protein
MNKLKDPKVLAALTMIIVSILIYKNPMVIPEMIGIIVLVALWHILVAVIKSIKEDKKL